MKLNTAKLATCPLCPFCGGKLDAWTAMDATATPRRGDVSLCVYCSALLVFDGDPLTVRAPTGRECADILSDATTAATISALGGAVVQLQRKGGAA